MFIRRFLAGALFFLLLFGGLGMLRGNNGYGAGYEEGYRAGQQAAAGESEGAKAESAEAPGRGENGRFDRAHHSYRGHGHGWGWGFLPFAFFFGGIFKLFFLLFLMGMIFKFFGFRRHWRHGRRPPWHKGGDDDEPREKQPEDVEPDIRTA